MIDLRKDFFNLLKSTAPTWPGYMLTLLGPGEANIVFEEKPAKRIEQIWLVATLFKGEVVWVPIPVEAAQHPVNLMEGRRGDDGHSGTPGFEARKVQALMALQEKTGVPAIVRPLIPLEDHNRAAAYHYKKNHNRDRQPTGIACPKCGKELWDIDPQSLLASAPPQKRVGCVEPEGGCGWEGFRIA